MTTLDDQAGRGDGGSMDALDRWVMEDIQAAEAQVRTGSYPLSGTRAKEKNAYTSVQAMLMLEGAEPSGQSSNKAGLIRFVQHLLNDPLQAYLDVKAVGYAYGQDFSRALDPRNVSRSSVIAAVLDNVSPEVLRAVFDPRCHEDRRQRQMAEGVAGTSLQAAMCRLRSTPPLLAYSRGQRIAGGKITWIHGSKS